MRRTRLRAKRIICLALVLLLLIGVAQYINGIEDTYLDEYTREDIEHDRKQNTENQLYVHNDPLQGADEEYDYGSENEEVDDIDMGRLGTVKLHAENISSSSSTAVQAAGEVKVDADGDDGDETDGSVDGEEVDEGKRGEEKDGQSDDDNEEAAETFLQNVDVINEDGRLIKAGNRGNSNEGEEDVEWNNDHDNNVDTDDDINDTDVVGADHDSEGDINDEDDDEADGDDGGYDRDDDQSKQSPDEVSEKSVAEGDDFKENGDDNDVDDRDRGDGDDDDDDDDGEGDYDEDDDEVKQSLNYGDTKSFVRGDDLNRDEGDDDGEIDDDINRNDNEEEEEDSNQRLNDDGDKYIAEGHVDGQESNKLEEMKNKGINESKGVLTKNPDEEEINTNGDNNAPKDHDMDESPALINDAAHDHSGVLLDGKPAERPGDDASDDEEVHHPKPFIAQRASGEEDISNESDTDVDVE